MQADMNFKQGGLLERLAKEKQAKEGTCATCCNLVQLSETAYACTEHDKLIMPRYIPYHGNCKCGNWRMKDEL